MSWVAEPAVVAGGPARAEAATMSPKDKTQDETYTSIEACDGTCSLETAKTSEPVLIEAQRRWAARPLGERLQVLRRARHAMATHASAFAKAISPALSRSEADTLIAELLPLLDAMRFLERQARRILAPRVLGSKGRPLWLTGVRSEVHREPLGHILVIAPANFPLFLPGVQVVQALAAGNAVTWKPGEGGAKIAGLMAFALQQAGLPRGVLHITEESVEAARSALARQPDKVIFTGSFRGGQAVLATAAENAIPAVVELSGADAVVVLPSADLNVAAKAIAFGLRLNGGEVCMSPRRLLGTSETLRALRPLLDRELAKIPPVVLKPRTADLLRELAGDALLRGATLAGDVTPEAQRPLLIEKARPEMAITRSDLFAPVLSVLQVPSTLHLAEAVNDCPFALAAAIFGNGREARALGELLRVGTVLINDLIAPTADPRVPFGGRGRSGYGVTRGAEGLLEMTAVKTVLVRRKGTTRQYEPMGASELPLFLGLLGVLHGGSLAQRWKGLRGVVAAGRSR